MYGPPDEVLASEQNIDGSKCQFWWVDDAEGGRGAKVIKTDQHGMRWTLDVGSTHVVTQRIAAGLLRVTVMTVNKWVRDGVFGTPLKRRGVSVIPMKAVERIAEARGILRR